MLDSEVPSRCLLFTSSRVPDILLMFHRERGEFTHNVKISQRGNSLAINHLYEQVCNMFGDFNTRPMQC